MRSLLLCLFFRPLPQSPSPGYAHESRVHCLEGARTPLTARGREGGHFNLPVNSYMTAQQ